MNERNDTADVATNVRSDLFEVFVEASRQMRQFLDETAGSLGLAERTPDPNDRRVRQVTLTAKGHELQDRLQGLLYEANPIVVGLGPAEQETLVAMLRKLPPPPTSA